MVPEMIAIRGGDYEHVLGLASRLPDLVSEYLVSPLNPLFERMIAEQAFEVCEFSLANYIMLKDRGADWLMAIPVFPYRAFRHSALYVRKESPLRDPRELIGRRIGVPDYSMTAAVWTRGILKQQYAVSWADLNWVTGLQQRFPLPAGVPIVQQENDLEECLLNGQIDVLLTTSTRDDKNSSGARKLRCLFVNVQEVEEAFYHQTGLYPIHHTVVIRSDALATHRSLPQALFQAYAGAKAEAYERRLGASMLPWGSLNWAHQFQTFGGDPLPYGLTEKNISMVEHLAEFLLDQRLIGRKPDIASLFTAGSAGWRG